MGMADSDELREAVAATRSVVKAQMRGLRTLTSFLADLDKRLDALEIAEPLEAERDNKERVSVH